MTKEYESISTGHMWTLRWKVPMAFVESGIEVLELSFYENAHFTNEQKVLGLSCKDPRFIFGKR
jgi:hypothetical protein